VNQCDGCAAGMPLKDGKHYMGTHPEMACQKLRYLCVCGINDCPDAPEHAADRMFRDKVNGAFDSGKLHSPDYSDRVGVFRGYTFPDYPIIPEHTLTFGPCHETPVLAKIP